MVSIPFPKLISVVAISEPLFELFVKIKEPGTQSTGLSGIIKGIIFVGKLIVTVACAAGEPQSSVSATE